jgi:alkylation response protein AidB-like acyl-CoA dehydrogenase
MDFGFSEDQELLRQSARDFLEGEYGMAVVRRLMEEDEAHSPEIWARLAELGWLGLILPESVGGVGLDFVDLAIVLEEMGRVVMPGPFFSTAVCAASVLLDAPESEAAAIALPRIAAGKCRATVAWLEASGRLEADAIETTWRRAPEGIVLEGVKVFVPDALGADLFLLAARAVGSRGEAGIDLFVVPAETDGLRIVPLRTLDQTRKQAEVCFEHVVVDAAARLGGEGSGWPRLQRLADRARVALSAESCGGAARVLEMSVEYAKVREQFGKPIGSFQAIQHKCADMMVKVESGRSAVWYAAWAVANDASDAPLAAAMAKAYCSDACREVAAEGIQIHGGIGFTWEHDMHIYFKRAKSSEVAFGDSVWNRERVAQTILPSLGRGDSQ